MRPSVGSARRVQQLRERGLARPGRAHDRDARAGIDHDRHVTQRGLRGLVRAGTRAIRERHVLDRDRRRTRRQHDAGVGLDDVDRRVEQVEHPPPSRHRGLGLVEDLGDLGDGLEEPVHEQHEADELARGEARCRAHDHADDHDRAHREHREQLARREHERVERARLDPGAPLRLDRLADVRGRRLGRAVATNHCRAHHDLGHRGEQVGDADAEDVVRSDQALLQHAQQERQRRTRAQRDRARASS